MRLINWFKRSNQHPGAAKVVPGFFIMSKQFFNSISLNNTAIIIDGVLLLAIILLINLLLIALLLLIKSGGMRLC